MDQRQKDSLSSATPQLADEIDFHEIATQLKLANLITADKIEDIVRSVESQFSRNLKLLDSLQESESPGAFNKFIEILEITDNRNALEMISPKSIARTNPNNGGGKSAFTLLTEKFTKMNFKRAQQNPLIVKSANITDTSFSFQHQRDPTSSSPLKEKHQATLISGSSKTTGNGGCDQTCDSTSSSGGFRLGRNNSGLPMDLSPVVPSSSNCHNDDRNKLTRQLYTNKYSQTPTRPRELNFNNHNRSISDTEEENSVGNPTAEPIVCWHPYAHERTQPQSSHQDPHRASSPAHYCLPSYASSESDSSSDSFILDQNLVRDPSVTMALANDGVHMMRIQNATTIHESDKEDYKMEADPRGPCLIVNNIDFEGEILPTRKGSDEDSRRFDEIFTQLGFTVIMRRNLTADQMRQIFKEVAAECTPKHNALFVFVLSHGSEHGIYGTDGLEVSVENEILPCFDNRNCKAMREKPKVFIIQACRGMAHDFGDDHDRLDSVGIPPATVSPAVRIASQENREPSFLPSSQQLSYGKKRKHPSKSDMLIVYPCLAGYVSVRNELRGSWLGVALAYFILLEAHQKDFIRILNLVTSDVIQRESSSGHIQALEWKAYGWTKNLYFNPGHYRHD